MRSSKQYYDNYNMPSVEIIYSTKTLRKYLKQLPIDRKREGKYLILDEVNQEAARLLEEKGFKQVIMSQYDTNFENRFLREYIDLIGGIDEDLNNTKWWATNMASKNRFTSRLHALLWEFLIAIDIIKKGDYENLVIFSPAWGIEDSLNRATKDISLQIIITLEDYIRRWIRFGLRLGYRILSVIYSAAATFIKIYYARFMLGVIINTKQLFVERSYVIKTFIYNNSFSADGGYVDAFFGALPEYLKKRKEKVLIYANILGSYPVCIKKIKKCKSQIIFPIEIFLSSSDILIALIKVLFYRIKIQKDLLFFGFDISGIVNNELMCRFNDISFYQFLHYYSTKRLVNAIPVKTFLLTYENNPWEKMCIMAIKKYSKSTKILGYQHAAFPKASANMFISAAEQKSSPLPDKVITIGMIPKQIMERYGSYKSGFIEPACGLRFKDINITFMRKRMKTGNILVALEGTLSEALSMTRYVLGQLKDNVKYTVTLRPHPSLPIRLFQNKIKYDLSNISNFRISKGVSLKQDIESNDIVIYFGSTVALESLRKYKPVIHISLNKKSFLSYDPLFECSCLKSVVSEQDSLIDKIEKLYNMNDQESYNEKQKAISYLNHYFYPVNEEAFQKFLHNGN